MTLKITKIRESFDPRNRERVYLLEVIMKASLPIYILSYIVFKMAQSEPNSGVKGKAIYKKNLSN